jgi:uncharacterized glyoxalase superfamily protein PhnB
MHQYATEGWILEYAGQENLRRTDPFHLRIGCSSRRVGFGGVVGKGIFWWQAVGMSKFAKDCVSTVIPALRYQDGLAAIDWLCRALGFERRAVYLSDDGKTVMHAELTFGNGMVMIGSVTNGTPYSELVRQPKDVGAETQSPYLVVADVDAIYASAKAAGAVMVSDLEDKGYGGKGFTCSDPEGHLWAVGDYDPWAQAPAG